MHFKDDKILLEFAQAHDMEIQQFLKSPVTIKMVKRPVTIGQFMQKGPDLSKVKHFNNKQLDHVMLYVNDTYIDDIGKLTKDLTRKIRIYENVVTFVMDAYFEATVNVVKDGFEENNIKLS